jgi:hypothetical protein
MIMNEYQQRPIAIKEMVEETKAIRCLQLMVKVWARSHTDWSNDREPTANTVKQMSMKGRPAHSTKLTGLDDKDQVTQALHILQGCVKPTLQSTALPRSQGSQNPQASKHTVTSPCQQRQQWGHTCTWQQIQHQQACK